MYIRKRAVSIRDDSKFSNVDVQFFWTQKFINEFQMPDLKIR